MVSLPYHELLALARQEVGETDPDSAATMMGGNDVLLIDCREPEEFATGVIPGAWQVPLATLPGEILRSEIALDTQVIVYCASGSRSAVGGKLLQDMGFSNVLNLAGGINRWRLEGRPITANDGLTDVQRQRYARHLVLSDVGSAGQEKLLGARVAVIGAGGLGSPVALYLGAAGVGTLVMIDFDEVDASNLQRQILHGMDRLGQAKVDSARQTLAALNPDVTVEPIKARLDSTNALQLLSDCDVIVDGADNFPTRYLVNDASLHLRVPVVHGSIFRFEGQLSVFSPFQGPCYRCLFPQPPPPELAPNCAEAGVLGVLPGIIGSLQAMEALKLILGIGQPLIGRLMVYDALDQDFQTVRVRRNPECPACGDESRLPPLIDYDDYCLPVNALR